MVFTTSDGVSMYEGDKYWYAYKNDPNSSLGSGHAFSSWGSNYYTGDVSRVYFSSREKAQEYINQQYIHNVSKVQEPAKTVEPVKSELEIAYDKLTALCAKYCPTDITTVFIDVTQTYPSMVKKYTIRTETYDNDYKSAGLESLDDLIVLFHARLIEQS